MSMKPNSLLVVFLCHACFVVLLTGCARDIHEQSVVDNSEYVVFAWNDLGMHCLNPTYDSAVILPPYNTIWVQVVARGNPPRIVTENLSVEYSIRNNTTSYDKAAYGGFWDNVEALFGAPLDRDKGLNLKNANQHNGLSGTMELYGDHFEAIGIPVVPVDDDGTWDPYQIAEIIVRNAAGDTVAQTEATVPTSDEINCAKCHGDPPFDNIMALHDATHSTALAGTGSFLCADCHGSPALGQSDEGSSGIYLSAAIHGFHADKEALCYDCHPGEQTRCSRSLAHTSDDGNCSTCHGGLQEVADSILSGNRIPWADEPTCAGCHTAVDQTEPAGTLFRNAIGHGGMGCPACHGSPHAMYPSREASDNYQAIQYQNQAVPIGSCAVCHSTKNGGGFSEFGEEHGGSNPEHRSACAVCHTVTPTDRARWPHAGNW